MKPSSIAGAALAVVVAVAGCSGKNAGSGFTSKGGSTSGSTGGPGSPSFGDGTGDPTNPAACNPNPQNYDFPGNNCDDDGDGTVDNPATACDASLPVDGDAEAFARAIGLCTSAQNGGWGLVSATYTNTHAGAGAPNDGQHGILGKFGAVVVPREGSALGVLSSGYARAYDDPGGTSEMFKGDKTGMQPSPLKNALPAGFPKSAAGCPSQGGGRIFDLIDAKLEVKVPANASGIQFDFNFWSGEWPEYVCSEFNDAFIAYLTSQGKSDNISFDSQNNPVSVNNGFFDRCTPGARTGCMGQAQKTAQCPGGVAELAGTGFEAPGPWCGGQSTGGGATGWLTSKAPVAAGETITIEFVIWDTGDPNFDSSVLVDHFQWVQGNVSTGTERPPK
jgi:hypothetical protein